MNRCVPASALALSLLFALPSSGFCLDDAALEDLKSDIESYKKKIEDAENKIKTNESDQVKANSELEAQQKVVDQWTEKKKSIE